MLPSRLFRNTGLPPALRNLLTPHPSLPPTVAVQLRLRLSVLPESIRPYSNSKPIADAEKTTFTSDTPAQTPEVPPPPPSSSAASSSTTKAATEPTSAPALTGPQPLQEPIEPRLSITFTCTVKDCGTRSTHQFTKRAYTKGIVLVQCPGCKNRHLIADHLGWFKESTEDGKMRTVEDILKAKGEMVRRGRIDAGGVVEYAES